VNGRAKGEGINLLGLGDEESHDALRILPVRERLEGKFKIRRRGGSKSNVKNRGREKTRTRGKG